ncbi:MAG: HAMP domain-containing protein [candidate division Zixibacteria bacterium]|nr:HAMP domain-containing protein [candidate division Zixibacteria bacterium]
MNIFKISSKSSIKTKITGAIILVVSVIAVFIILYFPSRQEKQAFRGLEAKAKSLAEMLAYNVSPGLEFEDFQSVEEAIEGAKQNKDLAYIVIYDSKDRVFASYNLEKSKEVLKKKKVRKAESFIDLGMLNVFTPIFSPERKIGYLAIGISLSDLKKEVAYNQRITFLVSLFIIIFGIFIARYLSNVLSKPILKLTDAARSLSRGETEVKVEIQTEDEIGILAKAFNQMIVDLKKSREQLLQQEKLACVGQLAAGVAHELNNPLSGILGYSQFALEKITQKPLKELTEEDISTYSQYLKDMEQQSKRCKAIIQSLLKFSRASIKEDFEPTDVNSILKEIFTFVKHQLEKHKVKLEEGLSPSLPLIIGNVSQLQQVFTNLILNAIQAMPDGGKLTVLTKVSEDKKTLEISFADTGEGISKENLSKIFEPFFTTKKVGQGTGLGLSVSYGIVKDHGGDIQVENTEGKGTTFTVVLPVRSAGSVGKESEITRSKDKRAYPKEVIATSS